MNKRKLLIGILIIICLLLVGIIGFIGVKVANENKINNYMKLGIMYLQEDKYEKAKGAFSKVISIDGKQGEALELLALTEDYMKLEELYNNKDYLLASDLISKISENKYLSYIKDNVNEISSNAEAKIVIIKEINNLDSRIEVLLKENKFKEANELINRYLGEDLKEEYLDKLSGLINKVNDSRKVYEEEQARIEEEKRLEEERLAEEERKRQEQLEEKIVENGFVNLIVEGFIDEDGYTYINADQVYWEWTNFIPGYKISGIDGDTKNYKLSFNCIFAKQTLEPTDPKQGEVISFDEFKNEIIMCLGYIPRARLCVAEIVNGEIINISTVYTP